MAVLEDSNSGFMVGQEPLKAFLTCNHNYALSMEENHLFYFNIYLFSETFIHICVLTNPKSLFPTLPNLSLQTLHTPFTVFKF